MRRCVLTSVFTLGPLWSLGPDYLPAHGTGIANRDNAYVVSELKWMTEDLELAANIII